MHQRKLFGDITLWLEHYLSEGSIISKKRCTDFEIFGFHYKISLIFHKILLTFQGHYTLINNTTLPLQTTL